MLSVVRSAALLGIDAYPVTIEVDISNGLPGFNLVGLPDSTVRESRERVFSAIKNTGFSIPPRKVTVNLAPADIKKEGSAFDLPLALGILQACSLVEPLSLDDAVVLGELALDGGVRPARGILPVAVFARQAHIRYLILPAANHHEAAVVSGLNLIPVRTLGELLQILKEHASPAAPPPPTVEPDPQSAFLDFREVKGQERAKRAFEVAAAGAHNFLTIGSPGCGKSLMARRLPSILPPMSEEESLETSKIYSVAGLLRHGQGLVSRRPFRAPHHSVSGNALVGGGTVPRPGEVSLAHHGVLFLDELAEFRQHTLEGLRQPLEDGFVTISRTALTLTYPCRFMLIAAMNPCPCGYLMDRKRRCSCRPEEVARYLGRMSGPLLDRVDIHLEMPSLSYEELANRRPGEDSQTMRSRVEAARAIQQRRFQNTPGVFWNAHMGAREISLHCLPDARGQALLRDAIDRLGLSARAYDRILKVSRTIADLEGADSIRETHVAEAVHYRSLDRRRMSLA